MQKSLFAFSYFSFLLFFLLTACQSKTKDKAAVEQTLNALKDGQTNVSLYIGDQLFYPEQSIFKGGVTLTPSFLKINIRDQFGGHIMITFAEDAALAKKPYKLLIKENDPTSNSVMIGRLADKQHHIGEGYLMNEGEAIITAISHEKLVIHLNGITGKYLETDRAKWQKLTGTIVMRKPALQLLGINETLVFY